MISSINYNMARGGMMSSVGGAKANRGTQGGELVVVKDKVPRLQDNGSLHIWREIMTPKKTKKVIADIKENPQLYNWFGRVEPTKKGLQKLSGALDRYGYENWDSQYATRSPAQEASRAQTLDVVQDCARDIVIAQHSLGDVDAMRPLILRPSDKGGYGVFALKDFAVGEDICQYPIHYFGRGAQPTGCIKWLYATSNEMYILNMLMDHPELRDDIGEALGWLPDEDAIVARIPGEGTNLINRYQNCGDYGLGVGDDITIFADPTRPVPSLYYGAFMNDGAYRIGMKRDEYDSSVNNAGWIDSSNAPFDITTNHRPGRCVAGRSIKKGDEICIGYGRGYWFGGPNTLNSLEGLMQYGGAETAGLQRAQCLERGFAFGPEAHGFQIWRPTQEQTLAIMRHYM